MEVIKIKDFIYVFYLEGEDYPIISTVITMGNKAVIFDTMDNVKNAEYVKSYLKQLGMMHFIVVNTHWHWDHVGGNFLYQNSTIIAHALCKEAMEKNKSELEQRFPVLLPNLVFDHKLAIYLDEIKIELINTVIHSRDSIIGYIPQLKLLIAGDTLEDPIPYIDEVEDLEEHIGNIEELKKYDISRIIPSHGSKKRYYEGGYDQTLIKANHAYLSGILSQVKNNNLNESIRNYYGQAEEIRAGYKDIHRVNLELVRQHFGGS